MVRLGQVVDCGYEAVVVSINGVGFRPFVYELARQMGLGGFVRNQSGSVLVEIEGEGQVLDSFVRAWPAERDR